MPKQIRLTNFLLAAFVVVVIPICAQSQKETKSINQKSAGILLEYGSPYYCLPEGQRYYAFVIGPAFSIPLFHAKNIFNLSVDIFPHYGFVWLDDDRENHEFGLNVRLGFNLAASPNDLVSFKIASGPHYITVDTEKQAKGFIFSDYYLITYDRRVYLGSQSFAFELEFGYRHMSNAGIQSPNRSICNFIFGMGFSVLLQH